MNAAAKQARKKEVSRRAAQRLSPLAREAVDKARQVLLGEPRTAATIDALDDGDLQAIASRTAAAVEQLLAAARGRRRLLTTHKTAAAVPTGAQRYHALLLDDALGVVRSALPELHRLALRLEVSGLNGDLSRFYVGQILAAPRTEGGPSTLRSRFEREEPKAMERLLSQAGLSRAAIDDIRAVAGASREQIDVAVLAPDDRDYPGAAGGGGGGAGGGGVGSAAVGSALGSIYIPKGLSGVIEGAIEHVRGIVDTAIQQDWTYGFVLPDGTATMRVDFGPQAKDLPPSTGGQLSAAGSQLREIGGWLFLAGLVIGGPLGMIGLLLYLGGLLLGLVGLVWSALSSGSSSGAGFVDP